MTSKDFLYLGIIVVASLVSYCHGFFSGVNRARKLYETLLGGAGESSDGKAKTDSMDSGEPGWTMPESRSRLYGQDLRGDFGNN